MQKEKNKIGRPAAINDETVIKAKEYLYGGYEQDGGVIPSVAGLACYLGIGRRTIYDYQKSHPESEFSHILEGIAALQENKLLNGGLKGEFNSTITKLMLTKHDYSEKHEVDNTSSDGSMTPTPTVIRLVGVESKDE